MSGFMNLLEGLIMGNSLLVYIIVFLIGFISSLNPHMLGMVPIYLGTTIESEQGKKKWSGLFLFALSFSIILTALGMIVSTVGMSLHSIMTISYTFAGIIYLYLGLRLLGLRISKFIPFKIVVLYTKKKKSGKRILSNIFLPLIFTPCSLPFIISVLTLAMMRGSIIYGGLILLVFGLGHSLIFILFGAFSNSIVKIYEKIQHGNFINKLLGALLVILGVVFLLLNQSPEIHNHH
ncbi:sulfite exporter TauE/SafE family protein [Alkalicella caledoniensis]|uniref:Sulfite exporter TauE/SafE family protein n=1 Tax=Alkalicella caledoniensis TaxID=2731377 RepID=A0A7G9WBK4_ALKCA|nr:cytochrome c biogenesis protein CcdA [Alkalicella caledoniensis]QNO16066.1 sulfite exporter TauE/SafE family protein [Alkalicella caledoniensis]